MIQIFQSLFQGAMNPPLTISILKMETTILLRRVFVVFCFLLEITEDGHCHQQRCKRNGVANCVHEMESLEHLLKQNKNMLRLCMCADAKRCNRLMLNGFIILQTSVTEHILYGKIYIFYKTHSEDLICLHTH